MTSASALTPDGYVAEKTAFMYRDHRQAETEVDAAGHGGTIINIKPMHVGAWL